MNTNQPGPLTLEEFFAGHPEALAIFARVEQAIGSIGPASVRVTRSQVTFRRRRGFAYVWLPSRWLHGPVAEAVLSIALSREVASPRFKSIVHPSPRIWMHHLEVAAPEDIDADVRAWLVDAYKAAV